MNYKTLKVQLFSVNCNSVAQVSVTPPLLTVILLLRSRLENNTEDWSALLLSLTDLNDWLGKKEAELIGLSPIGGDESSLRRQQVRPGRVLSHSPGRVEEFKCSGTGNLFSIK